MIHGSGAAYLRRIVVAGATGAAIAVAVLMGAHRYLSGWELGITMAGLLLTVSLIEVFSMSRRADAADAPSGIGSSDVAVVLEPLAPAGKVRYRGEIWSARSRDGSTISSGETVRVETADALTLLVGKVSSPTPENERSAR